VISIVKLQVTVFPSASVAVNSIVEIPTGNSLPDESPPVCTTSTSPELSNAVGVSKLTLAPQISASFGCEIFSRHSRLGASESLTMMVKLHSETFPALSSASKVMVVVPSGNSDPEAGPAVCITVTSQLSVAVASLKSTIAKS